MRVSIFGAPLDTGNLGVSAIGHSLISGLVRRIDGLEIAVFGFNREKRHQTIIVDGQEFTYEPVGSYSGYRIHKAENLWNMALSSKTKLLYNPNVRKLRDSDVVLDATGGDSFSDIYGSKRFRAGTMRKQIALRLGRPLVLLPQSYGPFRSQRSRAQARNVIKRSALVWTRDEQSLEAISDLFGECAAPSNCRSGVDLAFLLDPVPLPPHTKVLQLLLSSATPRIGINVSGLLFDNPDGPERFDLRADYKEVLKGFIEWFVRNSAGHIFFVPHVHQSTQSEISDTEASQALLSLLSDKARVRVSVIDDGLDQNETKWLISNLAWFCGARMHATIAAISSFVPTAVLAYSGKAAGVFGACGMTTSVIDMRRTHTASALEDLIASFKARDQIEEELRLRIPPVLIRASRQMDQIAEFCLSVR